MPIGVYKHKPIPIKVREKMSIAHLARKLKRGYVNSPATRKKLSIIAKERVRNHTHNFWRGGVAEINDKIKHSREYKIWRMAVFERDNWTCIFCGERVSRLNADHIKPFAFFPELRFAIDNGRTLCKKCHRKTDTFGRYSWAKKKNEQIHE